MSWCKWEHRLFFRNRTTNQRLKITINRVGFHPLPLRNPNILQAHMWYILNRNGNPFAKMIWSHTKQKGRNERNSLERLVEKGENRSKIVKQNQKTDIKMHDFLVHIQQQSSFFEYSETLSHFDAFGFLNGLLVRALKSNDYSLYTALSTILYLKVGFILLAQPPIVYFHQFFNGKTITCVKARVCGGARDQRHTVNPLQK